LNRVAIIPARGGSKRILRKNIKDFHGKPMIAWSIEAAKESACFDKIIVSTDDEEIADISKAYGAEVPFMRPASLSDDYVGTIPVIQHALDFLLKNDEVFDYACCLYATAPFLSANDIRLGLDLICTENCSYVFSVASYAFPIQRAIRVNKNGRVSMFNPEDYHKRSQDLVEAWHDAGQFYWGLVSAWRSGKMMFSDDSATVAVPRFRAQDIDTPEDWMHAEHMFQAYINNRDVLIKKDLNDV
jgi:N-acylneuraminate cytidylyltransferase